MKISGRKLITTDEDKATETEPVRAALKANNYREWHWKLTTTESGTEG